MKPKLEKTIDTAEKLEFAIFCIENVAAKLNVNAAMIYYQLTRKSDILSRYIIPEYESLHTQSIDYIVSDIIDVMHEEGVSI